MFITDQHYKLRKQILANKVGIWKIKHIHVDHMTAEILSKEICFAKIGLIVALQQAHMKV